MAPPSRSSAPTPSRASTRRPRPAVSLAGEPLARATPARRRDSSTSTTPRTRSSRATAAPSLFVAAGVSAALALDHALVSGSPAVARPFVPARADFFFVTPGLAPIRLALRSARVLAQVVHFDLTIALAYNAITVALALAGRMSPLACAVLMPASS